MSNAWLDPLFFIWLKKCTGSCNVLSPKRYVLKETKVINFKAFDMIANKMEAKASTKLISRDCNTNSIAQHII